MNAPTPVPPWLRPGLSRALDFLPEAVIREMGSQLPGGFKKRQAILDQWRRMARGFQEVPVDFLDTLRTSLPIFDLLQVLDPLHLELWLPNLAPLAGPDLLAVALWLDQRPEVAALARPELLALPVPPAEEAKTQWRRIVENQFLLPAGITPPPPPPAVSPPPTTSTQPPPANAEPELERTRKWLADARRQLAEAQARHHSELKALRQQHQAEVQSLAGQRDALDARLREIEADGARQIREGVQQGLHARLRPWHARAVALEEHAGTAEPARDRLLHELRAALERQRQADRHQANLARLREDLQRLLDLRDHVQWARSESLHPLGDWPAMVARLEAAIVDLRRQLREIPAATRWAPDLAAELQASATPAELDAALARAGQLAEAGLLDAEARQWLAAKAAERRALLQDPLLPRQPPAPVRLREVLAGQAAGVILIDAYNWIGRAGPILGVSDSPDLFPESLQQLRPLLRKLGGQAAVGEILLFADGPRENTLPLTGNLRLVWSGGEGRHRADAVIRGHLEYLQKQGETRPVWVVSDDGEVRAAARHWEATVEACEPFARRVQALVAPLPQ